MSVGAERAAPSSPKTYRHVAKLLPQQRHSRVLQAFQEFRRHDRIWINGAGFTDIAFGGG
jgi:hypothetical protein